jgi:hypothetical protein
MVWRGASGTGDGSWSSLHGSLAWTYTRRQSSGDGGKATPYGAFPNAVLALEKLVKRLRQAGSGPLKFCDEAGPCGYDVHRTRWLTLN